MSEESPPPRLLIAAALRREVVGLRQLGWQNLPISQVGRWPAEQWRLPQGDAVAIATGVGEDACHDALIAIHARLHPKAILSVGWAGATCADLRAGDICVAEAVRTPQGDALRPHTATLAIARSAVESIAGKPWRFGTGLTSPIALPNEKAKGAAATEHGVQWVDMESAVAARLADRLAIPWLSVRAICDTIHDDLNLCPGTMRDESSRLGLILRTFLTHPMRLRTTLHIRRQMGLASDHLCQALGILVPCFLERL